MNALWVPRIFLITRIADECPVGATNHEELLLFRVSEVFTIAKTDCTDFVRIRVIKKIRAQRLYAKFPATLGGPNR